MLKITKIVEATAIFLNLKLCAKKKSPIIYILIPAMKNVF